MNRKLNLLLFSSHYDKALAAFIIADTARDIQVEVTMFFAFWGLFLLKNPGQSAMDDKVFYEKLLEAVTPQDPELLPLSKMNMGGIGKEMLLKMMEKQKAPRLTDLIQEAREKGVRFYGCKLSMDIMGLTKEELIPEVEVIDARHYLEDALSSDMQLFI